MAMKGVYVVTGIGHGVTTVTIVESCCLLYDIVSIFFPGASPDPNTLGYVVHIREHGL
jgi:hypothetical protein